jgi:hypothetical protein
MGLAPRRRRDDRVARHPMRPPGLSIGAASELPSSQWLGGSIGCMGHGCQERIGVAIASVALDTPLCRW